MALRPKLLAAAASAALAGLASSANAQLELLYTFEDGTDTTITNFAGGPDGTLTGTNFSFVEGTASGRAIQFNNDDNTFINSNELASALLGQASRPATALHEYTMTAVATRADVTGDSMVFGYNPASPNDALHNGFRDASAHQGHWGADTTGGAVAVGDRVHVAWRYSDVDADGDFEQQIFVNGVSVAGPNTVEGLNADENVLIGTSRNSGGFNGVLDNVRIFSNALSDAEIASLAASDPTFIPEPSAVALLGLGAAGLVARRRRR